MFLGLVSKVASLRLISYEALLGSSQHKGFNLRNKIDTNERWVRIILDRDVFIDGFFKQLNNPKRKIGAGRIRRLDIVVEKGCLALKYSSKVPASSDKIFNLDIDMFYGKHEIITEDEYISLSYNKFESWSDSTTKVIRGNDNDSIRQLTSLTSLS